MGYTCLSLQIKINMGVRHCHFNSVFQNMDPVSLFSSTGKVTRVTPVSIWERESRTKATSKYKRNKPDVSNVKTCTISPYKSPSHSFLVSSELDNQLFAAGSMSCIDHEAPCTLMEMNRNIYTCTALCVQFLARVILAR